MIQRVAKKHGFHRSLRWSSPKSTNLVWRKNPIIKSPIQGSPLMLNNLFLMSLANLQWSYSIKTNYAPLRVERWLIAFLHSVKLVRPRKHRNLEGNLALQILSTKAKWDKSSFKFQICWQLTSIQFNYAKGESPKFPSKLVAPPSLIFSPYLCLLNFYPNKLRNDSGKVGQRLTAWSTNA